MSDNPTAQGTQGEPRPGRIHCHFLARLAPIKGIFGMYAYGVAIAEIAKRHGEYKRIQEGVLRIPGYICTGCGGKIDALDKYAVEHFDEVRALLQTWAENAKRKYMNTDPRMLELNKPIIIYDPKTEKGFRRSKEKDGDSPVRG